MRRLDCLIAVEPSHLSESVYQIFLVTDFEIFTFAFASEIEPVYCLCLCVHESSRVLFAYACACHSDDVVGGLVRDGVEMSIRKVYVLLADYEVDGKDIMPDFIMHWHCAENQKNDSDCYQGRCQYR